MYRIVTFLISLLSRLPLGFHYFLSGITAWFMRHVIHYRYTTVVSNIARSFPELSYKEIDEVVNSFYSNLADVMAESIWALTASTETIGRQVRISGQEALNKAMSLNRNAIIMVGHLGNWEIFTGLPDLRTSYGIELDNKNFVYVYKKPRSRTAEKVISRLRTKHGSCSIIEAHNIARHIIKHRDGKEAFFFICDQNPSRGTSGITVDFLHQKTYMIEGPESIAAKMGMPVLYCGLIRHGRRDNEAHFELITENAAGCPAGYVTGKFAALLEQDIYRHKGTWLWSHKRWKKRMS
ncbi:MAG TPA: lysophospholipid acyltransferase family protein [Candidatus Coprenecus stercoravium]|uniref:Lysophospholipid acyltransferase family protein n=1 Tax=Candidatus Coprenecus stercoravium TaxID=2840735 RepID=A0A9D2GRR0_9BACT|nr:lysophospholipid acyltransferase family protein [Candidatus Coprenecus stercoravium]